MASKIRKLKPEGNIEKTYSEMIYDMYSHYKDELPVDMEIRDRINYIITVWNLACLSSVVSESQVEQMIELMEISPDIESILHEMIAFKKTKYPDFGKLIGDFSVQANESGVDLSVTTMALEEYFEFVKNEFIDEGFDDDEFDDEFEDECDPNFEPGIINRSAVILKYRQPFIDWLKSVKARYDDEDINSPNIYLIEEDHDVSEDWLKDNFDMYFQMELATWTSTNKKWPNKRSLEMFKEWFEIDYSYFVFDMENEPVIKE